MPNLTKRDIDGFKYRGGWDVRWDREGSGSRGTPVPGFGVRIYPSDEKAFVLSYRAKGRKRLIVLGRYGADLTLDQARERARRERVSVGEGIDPLEIKRARGRGKTFGDLQKDFMSRHVEAQKLKTADAIQKRLDRNIPPAWKGRIAASIEAWEIEELHQKIGKTRPYEANRLLANLKTMFKHAPRWKYLEPSSPNPTDGIKKFREHKRKRWVRPEELPQLAKAIDEENNIYARAAVWIFLLTGLRRSELLEAKRKDVDWQRGLLKLPDTKSDEEQYAPLNASALAIMQAIPAVAKNPYLLPGSKKGHHLVNIDKPWRRIRKAAGIEDVRLHDLRRTVGSWMTQADVDLNQIKNALRHANISTTLTYARLGADPAREAMEEHGRQVMAAAGRKGPVRISTKPD